MKVYTRDLLVCAPSPLANILLLDRLRRKYGEVKSDGINGSYFDLHDDEDLYGVPARAFYGTLYQEERQSGRA